MVRFLHNTCITFAAGCAGGLANSIVVWLFGFLGIKPDWRQDRAYFDASMALSQDCMGRFVGLFFLIPLLMNCSTASGRSSSLEPYSCLFFRFII